MITAEETWLPVVGAEDAYEVSDQGRVRSLARRVRIVRNGVEGTRPVLARILRPAMQNNGYVAVYVGFRCVQHVHRLVMSAFVGPCPAGKEVLHGDGSRTNNWLSNLRYGTRSENAIDVFKHGRRRLSREQVLYLRMRAAKGFYYGERIELAREWGVSTGTVTRAYRGTEYAHISA